MMRVSDFFNLFGATIKSCGKIMLLSRPVSAPPRSPKAGDTIVVLGNGPSLRQTIEQFGPTLRRLPTIAVNFMPNTEQFAEIRPDYCILADPLFFNGLQHENVKSLWKNLAETGFHVTLCVPVRRRAMARKLLADINPEFDRHITVCGFNFVGASGFSWFEKCVYRARLAMPRPRNVLIPAVMTAINAGYKDIYIVGADHSWLETLRVTDDNHVVSVQPHFYADSASELKRSETEYKGLRLHDVLMSFQIAFRAYHTLQRFAKSIGVHIFNATPGSYIDAFERRQLP